MSSLPTDFYRTHDLFTDPGDHAHLYDNLPDDVAALRDVVQGIQVHVFWLERYEVTLSEERKSTVGLRTMAQKLPAIMALADQPLTEQRPIEQRLVGNCRDFSLLLCSLLRHKGIPARARCGFGVYFISDHFEDHWVCEYWNRDQNRWIMVDAQLDEFQCKQMKVPFDPMDVPRDQFITGGKAWQMYRNGEEDPNKFGIFEWHGINFIRGNLVRDFLALNNIVILPWDGWGTMQENDDDAAKVEIPFADRLAELTLAGDDSFAELRNVFEQDPRLHIPADYQL